jgi:hypothetical protein
VPLKHAYETGGADWSREQKRALANDPLNLLAVEDNANQSKSASGPDDWRPPLKEYWSEYAKKWRAVKRKYDLKISQTEEAALEQLVQVLK